MLPLQDEPMTVWIVPLVGDGARHSNQNLMWIIASQRALLKILRFNGDCDSPVINNTCYPGRVWRRFINIIGLLQIYLGSLMFV